MWTVKEQRSRESYRSVHNPVTLQGPPEDVTIADMLPVLFNNSESAGEMKTKVVENSKKIGMLSALVSPSSTLS